MSDPRIDMLRRSIRANIAEMRIDSSPGAIAYDATLDPDEVAQLGRIQALVEERDSLLEQVKALEGQRDTLERQFARAVTYWQTKWTSARRTIKLLICIGGSVLAVETLALAGLIWRLL